MAQKRNILLYIVPDNLLGTIIMAGIIFYHPKLGEKRNKLLEEAFK